MFTVGIAVAVRLKCSLVSLLLSSGFPRDFISESDICSSFICNVLLLCRSSTGISQGVGGGDAFHSPVIRSHSLVHWCPLAMTFLGASP